MTTRPRGAQGGSGDGAQQPRVPAEPGEAAGADRADAADRHPERLRECGVVRRLLGEQRLGQGALARRQPADGGPQGVSALRPGQLLDPPAVLPSRIDDGAESTSTSRRPASRSARMASRRAVVTSQPGTAAGSAIARMLTSSRIQVICTTSSTRWASRR